MTGFNSAMILKAFDTMIQQKQITELGSFIELIDVRDTLEKPILYVKQDEGVRDFIVQDRDVVYRYRMMKNYDGGE